ncbi:uracil-DNA glycosylase [Aliifodinibius sp. S!AR15-10]|uniref:uracil-DNA glycosylase n=1 Tax=Aliifodinibius sp. S!AR15-10 TaxID=2950437 RepID=UPI0028543C44|nr:uracil-DNA glycosylase [Aliifodinibius sp. S!AR15-10]MDR8391667.1 uracil-DNA glycosylase [Aliifodinibius sp. S!AR15-10]
MQKKLDKLFTLLKQTPRGPYFNPWYHQDEAHDLNSSSPNVRRKQLRTYLSDRLESARYLCVAEALGYQGGHFTGIAMTSERILLGHQQKPHGIPADDVFRELEPRRTSKPEVIQKGFSEPTATIMWKALYKLGLNPFEVVLWNGLAWHPYNPEDGLLSNRTPTDTELEAGIPALKTFFELYPDAKVIAVGRKSEHCLDLLDVDYIPVRHPANGGAPKFRRQMKDLIEHG